MHFFASSIEGRQGGVHIPPKLVDKILTKYTVDDLESLYTTMHSRRVSESVDLVRDVDIVTFIAVRYIALRTESASDTGFMHVPHRKADNSSMLFASSLRVVKELLVAYRVNHPDATLQDLYIDSAYWKKQK